MPLRLTELRTDGPSLEVPDRYLLLLDKDIDQLATEPDIRRAIQQLFGLASTLSFVARRQTFETDSGDLIEIEQADEPNLVCVRAVR